MTSTGSSPSAAAKNGWIPALTGLFWRLQETFWVHFSRELTRDSMYGLYVCPQTSLCFCMAATIRTRVYNKIMSCLYVFLEILLCSCLIITIYTRMFNTIMYTLYVFLQTSRQGCFVFLTRLECWILAQICNAFRIFNKYGQQVPEVLLWCFCLQGVWGQLPGAGRADKPLCWVPWHEDGGSPEIAQVRFKIYQANHDMVTTQ